MKHEKFDFAWNLMTELRKEVLTSKRIRAQIVGFKITFVTTTTGLIVVNIAKLPIEILALPAFAAIFFDLLINGYSRSIKRIGFYCRSYIEPILKDSSEWPQAYPLWEEFMGGREVRQYLSLVGNLGITTLILVVAVFALLSTFRLVPTLPVLAALLMLSAYDIITFVRPGQFGKKGAARTDKPRDRLNSTKRN